MTDKILNIPRRIKNPTVGGYVTGAVDIIDDDLNKSQAEINSAIERPYNPENPNGMGRVVLKKNMVGGVNTLTQAAFEDSEGNDRGNTIYVIQYDFVLGEDITVPANCVLEFDGGSISSNGTARDTITGNNTVIEAGLFKIFNSGIKLIGTWNVPYAWVEWWGAKGDNSTDDTAAIQAALNSAGRDAGGTIKKVYLKPGKTYCISSTLLIDWGIDFGGFPSGMEYTTYYNFSYPTIKATAAVDMIQLKGTQSNNIGIHDLSLVGYDHSANAAIANVGTSVYATWGITIKNVIISRVRYGVYSNNAWFIESTIQNLVCYNATTEDLVGIGLYLTADKQPTADNQKYIWDLNVDRCQFYCQIGGAYIDAVTTSPINFRDCTFERCGQEVSWADYDSLGAFGVMIKAGMVNFYTCYFERCGAFWYNGQSAHGDYVLDTQGDMTYITNPDLTKTGDIVIGKTTSTQSLYIPIVTVKDTMHAIAYQAISINRMGKLFASNNRYLLTAYDIVGKYTVASNGIIWVTDPDPVYYGYCIAIFFENIQTDQYFNIDFKNLRRHISEVICYDHAISNGYNIYVNFPQLNRVYSYKANSENSGFNLISDTVYIGAHKEGVPTLGTPDAPFSDVNEAITLLSYYDSEYNAKHLHILNNIITTVFPAFISCVTVERGTTLEIPNTNVLEIIGNKKISGVSFLLNQKIRIDNSSTVFFNCTFIVGSNLGTLFELYNGSSVEFNNCTFNVVEGATITPGNVVFIGTTGSCIGGNNNTLNGFSVINTVKKGTYAQKPNNYPSTYAGLEYYATDLAKIIYWSGDTTKGDNGWVDANGNNPSQS